MKKFLSLVLAGIMCMGIAACGGNKTENAADDYAYVKDNGKMIIGYTDYAPMNYTDDNGEFVGFDTELAKAVCAKLGVEPEFVEIDWDNKFLALSSKSIDCVWNGMTITDEVKLNSDVTKAYVKNAQVVVMDKAKAADYKTVESLKGLKFVAEAGSAGEKAIADEKLDEKYTAAGAQTDALLEVKSGSADACVIDITMANAMTGEGTSYEALGAVMELTSEEYGIAFRKGSDITEKVNTIMDELKADGTLDELAKKYELTLAF